MLRKRCITKRKSLVGIILSLVVGISLIAQPMAAFAEGTSNTVDNSVDKSTTRVVGVLNTVSCYSEYGHEFLTVYDSGESKVDYTNPKNDYINSLVETAKGKVDRFGELSCEAGGEYLGYKVSETETNYDNRIYTWVSDDSDNRRHMEIDGDYARKITITVFGTANVEHPWDDGVVTKKATVEEDGEMTYTCTNCGEIKTEVIPKIDSEQKIIEKPAYKGDIIEDGLTHFMSEFYALDDLPDGTLVIVTNDAGDEIFLSLADLKALSGSDPVDDSFTLSLPKGYAFADGSTRCSCPFKILASKTQNSDADQQPKSYAFIDGQNCKWAQNSNGTLTFRASGDFDKFTGVKIDGTLIDKKNYSAVSGSTVVTLKNDYLKTLAVGTHSLTVIYTDGDCSTNFEIKATQNPVTPEQASTPSTQPTSPQTGDNSHMSLWVALLFISGSCLVGITVYRRKKNYNAD